MTSIVPIMLIKNEEFHIKSVLRPLVKAFGRVLVGDTGSDDNTLELCRTIPGVDISEFGQQNNVGLTSVRQKLTERARELNYDFIFVCDGDELYSDEGLQIILNTPIPSETSTGFTLMRSVDFDEEKQEYWIMQDAFHRQALSNSKTEWVGIYPFDVPTSYEDPKNYFYYPCPEPLKYHALHLHRLKRSSLDENVMLRKEKQYMYSLQNLPVERDFIWEISQAKSALFSD